MKIKLTIIVVVILAVVALVSFMGRSSSILGALLSLGYRSDLHGITSQIEKIPKVKLVRSGGDRDISLEHIWAEIHIEDKGALVFHDLQTESFRNANHLQLHKVGELEIRHQSFGYAGVINTGTKEAVKSWSFADDIDIGAQGVVTDLRALAITNVQSAVLHYDEIYRFFNSLPKYPQKTTLSDVHGIVHVIFVNTVVPYPADLGTDGVKL
jgi:hypothetical protein